MGIAMFLLVAYSSINYALSEPISQYLCPDNEIYRDEGHCDELCGERTTTTSLCIPELAEPGCYCKPGYRRQSDEPGSLCVHEKDCVICDEDQEYRMCGTDCPRYCGAPPGPLPCNKMCRAGCFCKDSYVLRRKGGTRCILESQCPSCS
ncbi:Trypsin Inhibitor like cysteine rich domain [Popillia japonica]|uniref:Trypsin Inhibitor like cysteine rich domain n=1 Tax=Popillia japonica TaxID=7064 RepID=A0AAW1HUT8_POPJA